MLLDQHGFDEVSIRVINELSWPVRRYVRVYLCEKRGLPAWLATVLAPFAWPLLATSLFNANKAIVVARRPPLPTGAATRSREHIDPLPAER
jgi:hypothetical protein